MRVGLAGRIAHTFIESKLTPLIIVASLGLGALGLLATPREEEPQIRVPMIDVMVAWPGAEPSEVASRIVNPIERAMWSVSQVDHVYSTARPGFALVTVRLVPTLVDNFGWQWSFSILALGPLFGIWAMRRLQQSPDAEKLAGGRG